jgi:stage II sporulation protein P
MDGQQRCLQIGSVMILAAIILRLLSAGALEPLAKAVESPETMAFLLYLETGRVVHPDEPTTPAPSTEAALPPQTVPLTEPEQAALCFSDADASLVEVRYHAAYRPDLGLLVTSPLQWDLQKASPAVLILHTHATESYDPAAEYYEQSSDYRTLDTGYNMVSIGAYLASLLEQGGITVLHDTTLHDYPSYNGSYSASRKTAQTYLKAHPQILMVLDLHRDAAENNGGQLDTSVQVGGHECAQLMMVVGTRQQGWEQNMALAVKLTALLEKQHPGSTRPISFRTQQFNQDLSPGALLIEVGAAGNSRQEALRAVEILAEGILALAKGANT